MSEQIDRLATQLQRNHWEIRHRVDGAPMSYEDVTILIAALKQMIPLPSTNFKDGKRLHYCWECGRQESE